MWCPYYQDGEYKCDLCKNTVSEAKHDNYCTDWNGTNYQDCDIFNLSREHKQCIIVYVLLFYFFI